MLLFGSQNELLALLQIFTETMLIHPRSLVHVSSFQSLSPQVFQCPTGHMPPKPLQFPPFLSLSINKITSWLTAGVSDGLVITVKAVSPGGNWIQSSVMCICSLIAWSNNNQLFFIRTFIFFVLTLGNRLRGFSPKDAWYGGNHFLCCSFCFQLLSVSEPCSDPVYQLVLWRNQGVCRVYFCVSIDHQISYHRQKHYVEILKYIHCWKLAY